MRLLEIGACDHELLAAHISGALDNIVQIILMDLSAVVLSPEHWIAKIDPDLDISGFSRQVESTWGSRKKEPTSTYLNGCDSDILTDENGLRHVSKSFGLSNR